MTRRTPATGRKRKAELIGDLFEQIAAADGREHPRDFGNTTVAERDNDGASPQLEKAAIERFNPETGEFYDLAVELPASPEAGREPFGRWLLQQQKREGWIGQLAKAAKADPAFPKQADPEEVRKHLGARGADGDMFEAIDYAELEWLAY